MLCEKGKAAVVWRCMVEKVAKSSLQGRSYIVFIALTLRENNGETFIPRLYLKLLIQAAGKGMQARALYKLYTLMGSVT